MTMEKIKINWGQLPKHYKLAPPPTTEQISKFFDAVREGMKKIDLKTFRTFDWPPRNRGLFIWYCQYFFIYL